VRFTVPVRRATRFPPLAGASPCGWVHRSPARVSWHAGTGPPC